MTTDTLRNLEARIAQTMLADQHRLRRLGRTVARRRQRRQTATRQMEQFESLLEQSRAERQQRHAGLPVPKFDQDLPVAACADEIRAALAEHQVIVVCGETGSGKSTQLPKICLSAGRGVGGFIGHTQPRRIAARTIAARLAQELSTPMGGHVGFKIRFTDTVQAASYVKLMTDGILLAETQQDRFLERYDTLIIDEAHERSLNIDFLLGYLKRLLPRRPELRLILTSATIDAARFAEHFAVDRRPAPIIQVSGRTFPVEARYRPAEGAEDSIEDRIVMAVEELCSEGAGDVLIFLPTEAEIRDVTRRLRGWSLGRQQRPDILPLYARLSASEQNRVFQTGPRRRIVLATNVAESSLTVPGICYVIDTGTARISRYSPRSKVQRLPVEPISRAAADQRQGRCGRLAPGICIRLYSEEDYLARDRDTTPEIRRTNLAAVILRMLALRLGAVGEFPFLDPPRADAIRDGYKTLFELGAIDEHRALTEVGRWMSRLPVDPRIARIVLAASAEGCLAEVLIIAAALEVQDPRERPAEKEQAADVCHGRFAHEDSDFLALLRLWDFVHQLKVELSRNQFRKACQQNFLSFTRIRQWQEVQRQLRELVQQAGLRTAARRDQYDPIHRALLTGFLSNLALQGDRHEYQAAGGAKAFLWPGSGLFNRKPKWVVAAEAVETTRRYLRTAARVEPRWIEPLAEHLVKRTYSDPFWSQKQGTVLAHEKVTLYGLPVISGRRAKYGPLDPTRARQLFIQAGLVERKLRLAARFYDRNRDLVDRLRSLGARARMPAYLVPDSAQYDFYDQRLPVDVYDVATLRRWLNSVSSAARERLEMRAEDLLPAGIDMEFDVGAFPDRLRAGGLELELEYRFVPGDQQDGISVDVPLAARGQLDPQRLEWLVPGLLVEKLVHLIRGLPKSIRRSLVPAPESARKTAALLSFGRRPFLPAVAEALSRVAGESIPVEALKLDKLPQHLRLHVRLLDDDGQLVAQGRDVDELCHTVWHERRQDQDVLADPAWQFDDKTSWDFGDLPAELTIQRAGISFPAYPALVDQGTAVSGRLLDDAEAARRATAQGVRRLVCLAERRELKSQVRWLPDLARLEMIATTLRQPIDLRAQLAELLARLAYLDGQPLPRSAEQFESTLQRGRRELPVVVQDVAKLLVPLWDNYQQLRLLLDQCAPGRWADTVADLEIQLAELTGDGFLTATPWRWLSQYPRYLEAMAHRLDKVRSGGGIRDAQQRELIEPFWHAYRQRRDEHAQRGTVDPELETYRWMLEELCVSCFAQHLGTAFKISPQRLEKQWKKTIA